MDNLTHSLTGLSLARAGLDRVCPRAALLLLLSANAPDMDIVGLSRGPLTYLEVHRGYTHSILFLPLVSLVCVAVTAMVYREKLPWLRAWMLCCVGIASHLLIDWTNSYGIRLLLPFSSRWFHSDLNSLYDGIILTALLFGVIWPYFAKLVGREIGERTPAGRGSARFALVFFLIFDLTRAVLHHRAISQLESRIYDGQLPLQTAALPDAYNPLHWIGVVETPVEHLRFDVNIPSDLDVTGAEKFYKLTESTALEAAKQTPAFRYFLYFSRFPVWSQSSFIDAAGKQYVRIEAADLRFGDPGHGSFHCVAIEDSESHVLSSEFSY